MKAKLRGTEIYFDVAGMQLVIEKNQLRERPVLFLLHGGPGGDHLRFKQTALPFADVAQLVFIDHRGCGRSKKTRASDYTLENNIEDVEALRQYLGLPSISVLGGSYGGIVAQGYAARYSRYVDKLLLVATTPSYHFMAEATQIVQQRGNAAQQRMVERLWRGALRRQQDLDQFLEIMEPLYSVVAAQSKKRRRNGIKTQWSCEAWNQGFAGFLHTFDVRPQLKKIRCKTLILAGEQDWICPPSQSREIAKHIRGSQLKIFKNCGHAIAIDAHKRYIQAVLQFLRK